MAMVVYRLVALLADPDALQRVNSQPYQTSGISLAELANHGSPFPALAHTQKRGIPRHIGQEYPYKKGTKRRLPPPLCAWLCSVKRSRLLLLSPSYGYASPFPSP
jgi:hypothetical protein